MSLPVTGGVRYWFSVQAGTHPFPPQWGRLASVSLQGCYSMFRSDYFGFPNWTDTPEVFGVDIDLSQEFECGACPPPIAADTCCDNYPRYEDINYGYTGEVVAATCWSLNYFGPFSAVFGFADISGKPAQALDVNWGPPMYHGPSDSWTKGNLGTVFGMAIDAQGNVYLTDTSCFGDLYNNLPDPVDYHPYGASVIKIDTKSGLMAPFDHTKSSKRTGS